MGPGQGFSQVCMIAGAGILSTTPEVLSVNQGTGLWMARGANSHCHLPAPGPQSSRTCPGDPLEGPCNSFSRPSPWQAGPCYGLSYSPLLCWRGPAQGMKSPRPQRSHPSKGSLHAVKSKLFNLLFSSLGNHNPFLLGHCGHPALIAPFIFLVLSFLTSVVSVEKSVVTWIDLPL